jgi:hypothetical protein
VGFAVVLKAVGDPRSLPIFIGEAEAQAIAMWLNEVKVPRPLTHDLLKNILDQLECRSAAHVEVCDLRDDTFYARLLIDRGDEMMEVDSRGPAMRLPWRCGSGRPSLSREGRDGPGRPGSGGSRRRPRRKGAPEPACRRKQSPHATGENRCRPSKRLKLDLEKAVREERYEDAGVAARQDQRPGAEGAGQLRRPARAGLFVSLVRIRDCFGGWSLQGAMVRRTSNDDACPEREADSNQAGINQDILHCMAIHLGTCLSLLPPPLLSDPAGGVP